jgi:hypothetical protein
MKVILFILIAVAPAGTRLAVAQGLPDGATVEARPQAIQKDPSADLERAKANLDQAAQSPQPPNAGFKPQPMPKQVAIYTPLAVKGAWLGINTSPPPAALGHQLKLPEGTGLVVDFIQPKSPAQQAGIRQYDLLVKLNDQLLINSEQLAVLVRTFKPGDEVRLSMFREGERQTVPVTLAEHDLPPLGEFMNQPVPYPEVRSVPSVPGTRRNNSMPGRQSDGPIIERNERSLTWLDGKHQITINVDNKVLTVSDAKTGRVMFKGTLDALDGQANLPEEVKDALERVKEFLKAQPDKLEQGGQKNNNIQNR